MSGWQWFLVEGVNPEPWTASEGSLGKRGGKAFVHFHKPEQLRLYQESVCEMFKEQNPHAVEIAGDIELVFYFWRRLSSFEMGEGKRNRRAAQADATNLQKSLEDSLQDVLYKNDRDIKSIRSVIVEQGDDIEPAILIAVGTYDDTEELEVVRQTRINLHQAPAPRADNIRKFKVDEVF